MVVRPCVKALCKLSAKCSFNYNTPSVIVMEMNEFTAIKLVLVGTVLLVVDITVRACCVLVDTVTTLGWFNGESWFDSW
jgi:hypothetical protein